MPDDIRAPRFSSVPLRWLLTVPFVILILVPAIAIATLSLHGGLKAVDELSRLLMRDVVNRVEQAIKAHLGEAELMLRSTFPERDSSAGSAMDNFADQPWLEKKLWELTAHSTTTSYVYYGNEAGQFVGVERLDDNSRLLKLRPTGSGVRALYRLGKAGDRSQPTGAEERVYDPRERPWYQLAKREQRGVWNPVYVSFPSGELVTTYAQPVYDETQHLLGVLAADVTVTALSDFLRTVEISEHGVAFIVDDKGFLVASSTADPYYVQRAGGSAERLPANQSKNELVRLSAAYFESRTATSVDGIVRSGVESSLGAVDVATAQLSNKGLEWRVVVAIPRSDFTAAIVRTTKNIFGVVVVALIAALSLGLWVLSLVGRDVNRLISATRQLAAGRWPDSVPVHRLRETSELARAFEAMVQEVKGAHDAVEEKAAQLESLNRGLEGKVHERTDELERKNVALHEQVVQGRVLTEALTRSKHEAEQAAHAKAAFLANMSHEIRTPINGVIGMTSLLETSALTAKQRDYVEGIRVSGGMLLSVINEILDLSKLESGKVELELGRFSIKQLISDAVRLVEAAAAERKLAIQVNIAASVPPVLVGDFSRLRQVIVNLMSNAVKFTHRGYVRLEADATALSEDRVRLTLRVTDSGIGIDPEAQRTLFEPFTQAGAHIAREYGGTGLGLAISKRLVEAMGGDIRCQSQLGVGSTFSVSLPLGVAQDTIAPATEVAPMAFPDGAATADVGAPLHVLVADDNTINQRLLAHMLDELHCTVELASNGAEAVEAVRRARFDLVLMDVRMPEMDGLQATRQVRATASPSDGPCIIAVTANTSDADRNACIEAGMNGYLSKPVTIDALRQIVAACRATHRQNSTHTSPPGDGAATSSADEPELLDTQRLAVLRSLDKGQGHSIFVSLIEEFVSTTRATLTALGTAMDERDAATAGMLTHRLRGSCLNFGAPRLHNACLLLERDVEASSWSAAADRRVALTRIAEQTFDRLRSIATREHAPEA